eukprot:TRINITY_DN2068_c0_g1_i1.p1 TRINITY_DN2068_c0_g1~~TRINITY_DN2068_c0_g1_i1.p1  ORF type:complete len:1851 (-),score=442.28 TRINITY_DN2068_c0_g1_i1:45-4826(-)
MADPAALARQNAEEQQLLARCIFSICYQFVISPENLERMVTLLMTGATSLPVSITDKAMQSQNAEPSKSVQVLLVLLFAIVVVLDPGTFTISAADPTAPAQPGRLANMIGAAPEQLCAQLDTACAVAPAADAREADGLRGALLLGWTLFRLSQGVSREAVSQHLSAALQLNAFAYLRQVCTSLWFVGLEERDLVVPLLGGLFGRLLLHVHNNELLVKSDAFDLPNMLLFVAALYKDQPQLVEQLWGVQPSDGPATMEDAGSQQEQVSTKFLSFVNDVADLLAPRLFAPYVSMLATLVQTPRCAQLVFDLLSGSHKVINWTYFFQQLEHYVNDLTQEMKRTGVRAVATGWKIRDEDVATIMAILSLVEQVARSDEQLALHLASSQQWRPLQTFFAFIQCPVAVQVKAALAGAITGFAVHARTTPLVWNLLGNSNLFQLSGGAKSELEQAESPQQRYPFTTAMLHLLSELLLLVFRKEYQHISAEPYMSFVKDSVLLRFDSRSYAVPSEKWELAYLALSVIHKFVAAYLQSQQTGGRRATATGQNILLEFLCGGQLLHKTLALLTYGANYLDAERDAMSTEFLQKCVREGLQLLTCVVDAEDGLIKSLSMAAVPVTASRLHRLLRGKNELLTLTKFLGNVKDSEIPLAAIKLIAYVSKETDLLPRVLLESAESRQDAITSVMRQLLQPDYENAPQGDSDVWLLQNDDERYGRSVKWQLLRLLIDNATHCTPNLTQLLLGLYPAEQQPADPASLPNAAPLREIVRLLSAHAEAPVLSPHVAERCYELLHRLMSAAPCAAPCAAYLRSPAVDFFSRQLALLPRPVAHTLTLEQRICELMSARWLLRSIAADLRAAAAAELGTHCEATIRRLFPSPNDKSARVRGTAAQFLKYAEFDLEPPPTMTPHYFTNIDFGRCASHNFRGFVVVNLNLLRAAISRERTRLSEDTYAETRRGAEIDAEGCAVVAKSTERNNYNNLLGALTLVAQAWRELVEVCASEAVFLSISPKLWDDIFCIYDPLLDYMLSVNTPPEVATAVSSAVFALTSKLHTAATVNDEVDHYPVGDLLKKLVTVATTRQPSTRGLRGRLCLSLVTALRFFGVVTPEDGGITVATEQLGRAFEYQPGVNVAVPFLSLLCQDAIATEDIWRAVAFATLDSILRHAGANAKRWIGVLQENGFVAAFLEKLPAAVTSLAALLSSSEKLFLYESEMSMLLSAALCGECGALCLYENGVVSRLSALPFLDAAVATSAVPSAADDAYSQAVLPVYQLLGALLVALPSNRDLHAQALDFVSAHMASITAALKAGGSASVPSRASLEALHQVLCVVTRVASYSYEAFSKKLGARLPALSQLIVSGVFAKYSRQRLWKAVAAAGSASIIPDAERQQSTLSWEQLLLEVCSQALSYCTVLVDRGQFVFAPAMRETDEGSATDAVPQVQPPLGMLVPFVRSAVASHTAASTALDDAQLQHDNISAAHEGDLDRFIAATGEGGGSSRVRGSASLQRKRAAASRALGARCRRLAQHRQVALRSAEAALLLLWRHVETEAGCNPALRHGLSFALYEVAGGTGSLLDQVAAVEKVHKASVVGQLARQLRNTLSRK